MQDHPEKHGGLLHEKQLLNVVEDLCHFILHEVVNVKEKQLLNVFEDLCHFILQEVVNVKDKFLTKHENSQRTTNTLDFIVVQSIPP